MISRLRGAPPCCSRLLGSDCTTPNQVIGGCTSGGACPPTLNRPHILAINNDLAVLGLFRDLLTDAGYQVSTQPYVDRDLDGIKALQPELIVLDYMWATEDASWSLLQMLRMDPGTADIPVSSSALARCAKWRPWRDTSESMGVTVVFKPFNIDQLLEAIRDRLGADRAIE